MFLFPKKETNNAHCPLRRSRISRIHAVLGRGRFGRGQAVNEPSPGTPMSRLPDARRRRDGIPSMSPVGLRARRPMTRHQAR